jgi:3-oxoacyl-[acyl-carrier protein] reductase
MTLNGEFAAKIVLVTGGSRGIGKGIGLAFARAGARVVLAASSADNLARASAEIMAAGCPAPLTVACDLRLESGCLTLFEAVRADSGRLDILVNCAGATKTGAFVALDDALWHDGFALKFFAAVRLCRLFWPMLRASHGHVVNIIGGAARTPRPEFLIGGSVNAALANFTKGLAALGIAEGVHVNAIHPGLTDTERARERFAYTAKTKGITIEAAREQAIKALGTARMGTPEDVAEMALFLASERARHVQGVAIAVDGGATTGLY